MDNTTNTRAKLELIIDDFILNDLSDPVEGLTYNDKLHIIISESSQALAFVATIEDEFDVELDDDDIDLNFFLDFEVMLARIQKNLLQPLS
jgi:hypothetical protein